MSICTVLGLCLPLTGVPQVQDGDTLYLKGNSIRLHGIDAEELNEPNGPYSKQSLESLVGGNVISCHPTGQTSHHRIVARCYLGGIEVNRALVERGAALDCYRYSRGEYRAHEPSGARARLIQKPYCK